GASAAARTLGCSWARTRVYMSTAALVAQYTPQPGIGLRPAPEEMFKMRQSVVAAARSTAAVSTIRLVTLSVNALLMAVALPSRSLLLMGSTVPALLIKMQRDSARGINWASCSPACCAPWAVDKSA